MSDDRNHKEHIPQRKLGTALRSFFDHVTSHDEEGVHAALCMVANANSAESDGEPTVGMHTCNFGAGDPNILAQMMVVAIDTMIEEVPGFTEAWENALHAKRLQTMINQVLDVVKETKGMKAAKPTVDALIEKLKGNPGAVPGPDTKQ